MSIPKLSTHNHGRRHGKVSFHRVAWLRPRRFRTLIHCILYRLTLSPSVASRILLRIAPGQTIAPSLPFYHKTKKIKSTTGQNSQNLSEFPKSKLRKHLVRARENREGHNWGPLPLHSGSISAQNSSFDRICLPRSVGTRGRSEGVNKTDDRCRFPGRHSHGRLKPQSTPSSASSPTSWLAMAILHVCPYIHTSIHASIHPHPSPCFPFRWWQNWSLHEGKWVLFGSFSMFSNFYQLDLHNKSHVALAN